MNYIKPSIEIQKFEVEDFLVSSSPSTDEELPSTTPSKDNDVMEIFGEALGNVFGI